MNDEQQLWRDFQKFMNQFPGLIAVAKKIGQIGDLEAWQAAEQRKLEAITQEVEKQRRVIVAEREAMNSEVAQKLKDSEARLAAHTKQMNTNEAGSRVMIEAGLSDARQKAEQIVAAAESKAKEITDVVEPKKTALEAEIAALSDKLLSVKSEHETATGALAAAKDRHAAFIKQIVGTGG